jgi:hypothetical protein
MELEMEVKTIKVYYTCPKCKIGNLVLSKVSPVANPPENEHRCSNKECDYTEVFVRTIYPYIKKVEIPC